MTSPTADVQTPTGQGPDDDIIDTSGQLADLDAPESGEDPALSAGLEDEDAHEPEPVAGETPAAALPDNAVPATGETKPGEQQFYVREGTRFVKYVAPAPKPDPNPPVPFTANIYGKAEAIFGDAALYKPGVGVFIREDKLGELNQKLAHATHYPKMQEMRQERAAERKTFLDRENFQAEKFKEMLTKTILNPEWMTWAAANNENYSTAQMQAQLLLQQAGVEMRDKFGNAPTTTDADTRADSEQELREHGPGAVNRYIDEVFQESDFHGLLGPSDKAAILTQLTRQNVPLFHPGEQGWQMDERPIRLAIAMRAEAVRAGRSTPKPNGQPTPPTAVRRNAAAVPTPTAPAKPAPPKSSPARYAEKPWENPKLSRQEQKDAFYAHYNKVG